MLHTYEALLQPDGRLQFLDPPVGETLRPRRVLVTFTQESVVAAPATATPPGSQPTPDWARFVGALADSPNWNGDPVAIQEEMRREWD
ncbi:MAG: hypothetical protein L6Q75_07265 [Burkholderiaceae bacterium]|nr:hypothetical protein [Burkholderiaceae bacterium]